MPDKPEVIRQLCSSALQVGSRLDLLQQYVGVNNSWGGIGNRFFKEMTLQETVLVIHLEFIPTFGGGLIYVKAYGEDGKCISHHGVLYSQDYIDEPIKTEPGSLLWVKDIISIFEDLFSIIPHNMLV